MDLALCELNPHRVRSNSQAKFRRAVCPLNGVAPHRNLFMRFRLQLHAVATRSVAGLNETVFAQPKRHFACPGGPSFMFNRSVRGPSTRYAGVNLCFPKRTAHIDSSSWRFPAYDRVYVCEPPSYPIDLSCMIWIECKAMKGQFMRLIGTLNRVLGET